MTSARADEDCVRVEIQASADLQATFRTFTERTDTWWKRGPRFRVAGWAPGTLHLEPFVKGRLFEAFEHEAVMHVVRVGRVLVWEPPSRFVLSGVLRHVLPLSSARSSSGSTLPRAERACCWNTEVGVCSRTIIRRGACSAQWLRFGRSSWARAPSLHRTSVHEVFDIRRSSCALGLRCMLHWTGAEARRLPMHSTQCRWVPICSGHLRPRQLVATRSAQLAHRSGQCLVVICLCANELQ